MPNNVSISPKKDLFLYWAVARLRGDGLFESLPGLYSDPYSAHTSAQDFAANDNRGYTVIEVWRAIDESD